jgi:hypothetical protein
VNDKCSKCVNRSFVNLPAQLVNEDCVSTRVEPVVHVSADVSSCEIVPYK